MAMSKATEFETACTVVYPWLCDSMEHLATQSYMKVFDDAAYHLLARLGYSLRDAQRTRRGWVDVSHSIEYLREVRAGDLLVAFSAVQRLGRTSMTYITRLAQPAAPDDSCAVMTGVVVHFDLDRRQAIELPDDLRITAAATMQR